MSTRGQGMQSLPRYSEALCVSADDGRGREGEGRGVVQSRGKEAEEAEEEAEEEEEGEEEDGQTRGGDRGSSWSYCLSGVVARGSADRGDIARREGDRRGDGGCQRMRGRKGALAVEGTKHGCGSRSEVAEEEGEKKKTKDKEVATSKDEERKRPRDAKGNFFISRPSPHIPTPLNTLVSTPDIPLSFHPSPPFFLLRLRGRGIVKIWPYPRCTHPTTLSPPTGTIRRSGSLAEVEAEDGRERGRGDEREARGWGRAALPRSCAQHFNRFHLRACERASEQAALWKERKSERGVG
ncbi:hypothetical protein ALC60_05185 [Trachymyrmex zeteki]|uniref:Uncharacterized protein n=1 Tax=Mycetomoellerius zeteki TaxID=64791 RepID=A0A151X672_9HYME|nr:hypothetical protein ALC60_05185 [Trachymyrmex zeteki]